MEQSPYLSLILPCFNEETVFNQSIKEIAAVLEDCPFSSEIIFVDDSSQDNTPSLINKFVEDFSSEKIVLKKIFHSQNFGRGKTVADGFKEAQGEIAGFVDIDLETPAYYIPLLLKYFQPDFEVVVGQRVYTVQPKVFHRFLASRGYNFLVRKILGLPYQDTEAGYKFFRRNKVLDLLEKVSDHGWFWDTEIMYQAFLSNLKVKEAPVLFLRREDKKSTVNFFKDSLDYFWKLLRFKLRLSSDDYWKKTPESFENQYQPKTDKNNFVSHFLDSRLSKIKPLLSIKVNDRVLDVGCGSGSFMRLALEKNAHVTGLDYSAKTLALAKVNLPDFPAESFQLILGDAGHLPFENQSFDWVLAIGLLDYLEPAPKTISELSRVVKDDGNLVMTAPKKYSPFFFLRGMVGSFLRYQILKLPPIIRWFDKKELLKLFKENNLTVEKLETLEFTMWIAKLKKRRRDDSFK